MKSSNTNSLTSIIHLLCYRLIFPVEDFKLGICLTKVGGIAQETRDKEGKDTFIVLDINQKIHGHFPEWYMNYHSKSGTLKVLYAKFEYDIVTMRAHKLRPTCDYFSQKLPPDVLS